MAVNVIRYYYHKLGKSEPLYNINLKRRNVARADFASKQLLPFDFSEMNNPIMSFKFMYDVHIRWPHIEPSYCALLVMYVSMLVDYSSKNCDVATTKIDLHFPVLYLYYI